MSYDLDGLSVPPERNHFAQAEEYFGDWQQKPIKTPDPSELISPPELGDFLAEEYPEPARRIGPINNESVVIAAAPPGVGKTNLAVAMSHACSTGRDFIGWNVPNKASVLYVDGEMSGRQLQDRLNLYRFPDDREPLHIVNAISWASRQGLDHPNLAQPVWQDRICEWAKGRDLVMLDNVMSLVNIPGLSFSSDEFWRAVQPLNLRLRAMGCTVVWWDHTNAEGRPFGTRTKEWGSDLVFTLKENEKSPFYEETPGVAFTLSFRKVRGAKGREHQDIDVEMRPDENGKAVWTWASRKIAEEAEAAELQAQGLSQRRIAAEMGISLGKVNKLLKTRASADEYARRRG